MKSNFIKRPYDQDSLDLVFFFNLFLKKKLFTFYQLYYLF